MSLALARSGGIEASSRWGDLDDGRGPHRFELDRIEVSMDRAVAGLEETLADERLRGDVAIDGLKWYVASMERVRPPRTQVKKIDGKPVGITYAYYREQFRPNPYLQLSADGNSQIELHYLGLPIERNDFMRLTEYILTNTRLDLPHDPRIPFVNKIRAELLEKSE